MDSPSVIFPPLVLDVTSKAVLLKVWSTGLQITLPVGDERKSLCQNLITVFLSADFVVVIMHLPPPPAKYSGEESKKGILSRLGFYQGERCVSSEEYFTNSHCFQIEFRSRFLCASKDVVK